MIYKRCPICGKRIIEGTKCACQKRQRNQSNRTDGIRKQYRSYRWQQLRDYILRKYDYIDLYALYHNGVITPADTIHHITEALSDPDSFFDETNLFPLSQGSHYEIHERYKHEDPDRVREELREYKRRWQNVGSIEPETPGGP